jgi:hypothetical protein
MQQDDDTLLCRISVIWKAAVSITLRNSLFQATGTFGVPLGGISGTVSITQEDNIVSGSIHVATPGIKRVNFRLTDGLGAPLSQAAFKWAFFDQSKPNSLTAPAQTGTGISDSNGNVQIDVNSSNLSQGSVGYIVMSDTEGDPDTPWKQHSGPIRVL